jgi:Na+-transporting methylmalonyl-CoA/oxaloacetate decarboxylase gamma subunit
MDDEPKLSPFKLTQPRIILLIFGVLLLLIVLSTAMGGFNNYKEMKDASAAAKDAAAIEATTPAAPAVAPAQ